MKFRSHTILNTIFFFALINAISFGQSGYDAGFLKVPIDSILFDGFKAVTYNYEDSAGHITSVTDLLSIFKDNRELIAIDEGASAMVDFCGSLPYIKDSCYFQDINKDGFKEMMVQFFTGGANCCFGANLYSVNDSLRLIFRIEPNLRPFDIADLDSNQVPEFIFCDETFAFWKDTYRYYLPSLIWRWDGSKYRIANLRYRDYLIKKFNNMNGDTLVANFKPRSSVSAYDIQRWISSNGFWETVIYLSYAGEIQLADSIFINNWPYSNPGREKEFASFKEQLESGKYWQEILNSNW